MIKNEIICNCCWIDKCKNKNCNQCLFNSCFNCTNIISICHDKYQIKEEILCDKCIDDYKKYTLEDLFDQNLLEYEMIFKDCTHCKDKKYFYKTKEIVSTGQFICQSCILLFE